MYRLTRGFGAYSPRGLSGLTDNIATAIAQFEGYNKPGSVAVRNNNPGNLRAGPGQTGTDANGYAIFPDAATGWAALDNQVNLNISRGLTLNQFFGGGNGYPGYAPSADSNNPAQYAAFVASKAGIPADTPLNQLAGSQASGNPSLDTSGGSLFDSTASQSVDISTSSQPSSGMDPLVLGGLALGVAGVIAFFA